MVWSEFVEEDHKKYEADTYFQVCSRHPVGARAGSRHPASPGAWAQVGAGSGGRDLLLVELASGLPRSDVLTRHARNS